MTISKLFIVGVGRSGTSLVQSMFAAHPKVSCLPETSFIRRMVFTNQLNTIYQKHGVHAASKVLTEDEYFARTGLDASNLLVLAQESGGPLDAAVYREMLFSYAQDMNWVGDKDPRAVEFLPLLAEILPDTHVIHVFRDPRDVLASKKKAAWSQKSHVWKHVFANRVQFSIGTKLGPKLFGNNYHEICYEELLSSPEKVLFNLCRKLGLGYDKRMLSFDKAAERLVTDKEMSWKKETLGPLLTKNTQKWINELHPREILLVEKCCGQAIAHGGYIKDHRNYRLNLKNWLWLQTGRILITLATRPYILYRNFRINQTCRAM
ncbi:sulfotransferase family protein [Thiohalophilus thiocyanatoxydans]|uniref:Sulfotransferase family protein n=1 Tax=Thiohalophilus thiocyanatoxydans TaxID=381308 RepID=A0A4R8IQ50_9GAMM|nr:sulfotransferase [Thiohalophilus thiocyanatoxydans]TDY02688.1 sulfotransferase family protein [Thiohalophilus thiocyanatoxydans]